MKQPRSPWRREGCNQISLMPSRAWLDGLPFMTHLRDSGTLGALPMASFFSPCPMGSSFPIEAVVYNPELKWRVYSLHHGGELQLNPRSRKKNGKREESWHENFPGLGSLLHLIAPSEAENSFVWLQLHKRDCPCTMAPKVWHKHTAVGCQDQSGLRFIP